MVITPLSLENINAASPYLVRLGGVTGTYEFITDSGVEIGIGFIEDDMVRSTISYQFIITNLNNRKSPRDNKIKETILLIVEEFFEKNQAALLYICETSDGKQKMRSRLFEFWFQTFEHKALFSTFSTTFVDEDIENFASVIIRNDNPDISKVILEFYETLENLRQKPRT